MWAKGLSCPLTGHSQVAAKLLDDLGDWLRSLTGGNFPIGGFEGNDRVSVLNRTVKYLFERLESEIAVHEPRDLLTYLIAQNESLLHNAKFLSIMLRARIACFGENSEAATDLVEEYKASASAQRANRFLIEYVAACPPTGAEVLAFHPASNTIVAVEAKDFETACTPAEIANEIEKLIPRKSRKRSTVELHARRIDWLRDNMVIVAAGLGLPASTTATVLRTVVTSEPLITPLMVESPFPVVAIDDLATKAAGIGAGRQRPRRGHHRRR